MTAGRSPLTAVSKTENKTEKEMNTIILMWNPAISSISYREYKNFFRCPVGTDFNWSVWDHDKAHAGDRLSFYRENTGENEFCIRIVKTADQAAEPIEVCRSKVVFY